MAYHEGSQTGWEVEVFDTVIFIFIICWENKKILSQKIFIQRRIQRKHFVIEYSYQMRCMQAVGRRPESLDRISHKHTVK